MEIKVTYTKDDWYSFNKFLAKEKLKAVNSMNSVKQSGIYFWIAAASLTVTLFFFHDSLNGSSMLTATLM